MRPPKPLINKTKNEKEREMKQKKERENEKNNNGIGACKFTINTKHAFMLKKNCLLVDESIIIEMTKVLFIL